VLASTRVHEVDGAVIGIMRELSRRSRFPEGVLASVSTVVRRCERLLGIRDREFVHIALHGLTISNICSIIDR
jgi:hypothetical protein